MTGQGRGPRAKPDPHGELRDALRSAFRWLGDRPDDGSFADPTGWWADPAILGRLGPALAGLFRDPAPTAVLGLQSRGSLLGALVAAHLGVGLVEVRKDPVPAADSDRWHLAHTPPDYRDRTLRLGVRKDHLRAGQRVLCVDDWVQTGGQLTGARALVEQAGAAWCGAAVIVDGLQSGPPRRRLDVRALLHLRDL
jgi:adenine phosphoribosyltransferase